MTRKTLVVGNWKMHGSKEQVAAYFSELQKAIQNSSDKLLNEVVVCPPFIYLAQAAKLLEQLPQVKLGAQDVSGFTQGAYTGQIAASMLVDIGCQYVIVGHSERRQYCQESEEEIADKFFAAKATGLTPILCVGETQAQREEKRTESVVLGQLQAILTRQGVQSFQDAIIAYEPVWAIGTGLTASPQEAQAVHLLLRQTLAEYDVGLAQRLPILYGGSVKSSNAQQLFAMPDIDGALVGGASLQASEFFAISKV